MSRNSFLLFILNVLFFSQMVVETREIPHEKVVIVGAGISGFGAASRLLEHNITSFRILEAGDRIGGRINSVHLGDAIIDLGAQYIHGEEGNIVYELSKERLLLPQKEEFPHLFYSNGEKLHDSLLTDFFGLFFDMEKNPGTPNISLSEEFLNRYRAQVLQQYKNDTKTIRVAEEFLKTIEMIFLTIEGAFDWYSLRSRFHNFQVYPGNPLVSWSGKGYTTIFNILRDKIGKDNSKKLDDRIHLRKSVKTISSRAKVIEVECHDGSMITADHLIFTASLGVLKHDHKEMFRPGLDRVKVEAINALGIGGIMKIGLQFAENWWENAPDSYFVWSEEDEKKLFKDVAFGPSKDGRHWLSYVYSISPAPNNPRVVIAWIGGPLVPEIEKMNAFQLKQGIMYVVRKFFGKTHEIKEPISMVHSKWCSDPHFRGAFSYEPVGVANLKNSPHEDLLKPVLDKSDVPRIFFAGEATHPKRFSAADGALASGFLQAEKLIKYLKNEHNSNEIDTSRSQFL